MKWKVGVEMDIRGHGVRGCKGGCPASFSSASSRLRVLKERDRLVAN